MEKDKFDVLIIGGGPSGLSAALWCGELGLRAILAEKNGETGGQLLYAHNPIRNYPGAQTKNGAEMRDLFLSQAIGSGTVILENAEVTSTNLGERTVALKNGEEFSANALIIATGVRRRVPAIPGIEQFRGRGLLDSGKKQSEFARGKTAMVVGGGDAALENALILSPKAKKVILVHRRGSFRARSEFVLAVREDPKIEMVTESEVLALHGSDSLESVVVRRKNSRSDTTIPVGALIFRIGVLPNSEVFAPGLDLDPRGYINVDPLCRTSAPGVYAVGDVANPVSPTVSTAAGSGATAAKAIFSWMRA